MDDQLLTLYAFNLGYAQQLLADITDAEFHQQPTPGVNTPAWILGHLAICTDSALGLLGQEKQLPKTWRVMFGPGSKPEKLDDRCPGKSELLEAYEKGHSLVAAAVPGATAEQLGAPNPLVQLPGLVKALPTAGDLLAHLLATHEAMHLGHLSNWRRQMGRPPLF